MRYFVTIAGEETEVELTPGGILIDGERIAVETANLPGTSLRSFLVEGASVRLHADREAKGLWRLHLRGRSMRAEVVDERTRAIRELTGGAKGAPRTSSIRAPMPGLVVRIEVGEGDELHPGDGVAIVEAMKMENELRAEAGGRVKRVLVAAGEAVEKDQVLVELEPVVEGADRTVGVAPP